MLRRVVLYIIETAFEVDSLCCLRPHLCGKIYQHKTFYIATESTVTTYSLLETYNTPQPQPHHPPGPYSTQNSHPILYWENTHTHTHTRIYIYATRHVFPSEFGCYILQSIPRKNLFNTPKTTDESQEDPGG